MTSEKKLRAAAIEAASGQGGDHLTFAVHSNIVIAKVRLGDFRSAAKNFAQVKQLHASNIHRIGRCEIDHLEGNIREGMGDFALAQKLYSRAYGRFVEMKEWRAAAFAALDLTVLHSRQNNHEEVIKLVSALIAILKSLELHPETLAAVALLGEALADMRITHALLRKVREQLRRDPLMHMP